jgi:hypothetical protein
VAGRLFEDHDRFGTDTIELHLVGPGTRVALWDRFSLAIGSLAGQERVHFSGASRL